MSTAQLPVVESVLHATDFSPESESAFAHALAIALVRQASFTLLHVGPDPIAVDSWKKFPGVRSTLERWGLLEPGSPRSAVFDELAVAVSKVAIKSRSALAGILDYVDEHPVDLIVLGTTSREGLPRWFSVAEPMARRSRTKTLVVPNGGRAFVSAADGNLCLRRVLIPVAEDPDPTEALAYAARAALVLGDEEIEMQLLHVGDPTGMPALDRIEDPRLRWTVDLRQGDRTEQILAVAEEGPADLIVMPTRGIDELSELVKGSQTEQVLRRTPCPLLAIPAA